MTLKEYVKKLAEDTGITQAKAEEIIAAQHKILNEMPEGESIIFRNYGTFKMTRKKEKKGRNPKTGEELIIPSKVVLTFKHSKKQ